MLPLPLLLLFCFLSLSVPVSSVVHLRHTRISTNPLERFLPPGGLPILTPFAGRKGFAERQILEGVTGRSQFKRFIATPKSEVLERILVLSSSDPIVTCTDDSIVIPIDNQEKFRVFTHQIMWQSDNPLAEDALYISSGSLFTVRGPQDRFKPGCIYDMQSADSDGMYSVARIVTAPLSYSLTDAPRTITLSTRAPVLGDIYQSGSVQFEGQTITADSSLFTINDRSRMVESELNSADPDVNSVSSTRGTAQTKFIGWNLNEQGNGPATKSSGFSVPFNGPAMKMNCTECYFGVSFGISLDLDWSLTIPSQNRISLQIFADSLYNFNLGMSFNVPKPKFSWRKTLYTYPVVQNRPIAMIGPVPIILDAEVVFSMSASVDVPVAMDNVFFGGASSRTVLTVARVGNAKDAIISPPETKITQEKPRGALRPTSAKASIGVNARFVLKLQKLMSLDFTTGPSMSITESHVLLTDKGACRPSPQLITQFSNQPNNPVVASVRVKGVIQWVNNINLKPMDISLFGFKWSPWSIRLYSFPTIELVKLFESCFPVRRNVWRILSARIDWGQDRRAPAVTGDNLRNTRPNRMIRNEAEYDAAPTHHIAPVQLFRQRKSAIYVDVTVDN